MMKRKISIILAVCLCFVMAIVPFGAAATVDNQTVFVTDELVVLTADELSELNQIALSIFNEHNFAVGFALCDDCDGMSTSDYAEKLYTENEDFGDNGLLMAYNTNANNYSYYITGTAASSYDENDMNVLWNTFANSTAYYDGIKLFYETLNASFGAGSITTVTSTTAVISENALSPRLIDEYDLLNDSEEKSLLAKLDSISESRKCDVVIVTVYSLDGKTAQAYADDFYYNNGYGYGKKNTGILLLFSMQDRDWAISTTGDAEEYFTDAGQERIMESVKSYLSDDDFNNGLNEFADKCDEFLAQAQTGEPYDVDNLPKEPFDWMINILIALGVGIVVSLIIMLIIAGKHKTVHSQPNANTYVRQGSFNLALSNDVFLYRNVTRTEIPKDNDSGGSSTHIGSSGVSHGGSSGKF